MDLELRRLERLADQGDNEARFLWIVKSIQLGNRVYGIQRSRIIYSDYGDEYTDDLVHFQVEGDYLWANTIDGGVGYQFPAIDLFKRLRSVFIGHPDAEVLFKCDYRRFFWQGSCDCERHQSHPYHRMCMGREIRQDDTTGQEYFRNKDKTCVGCGKQGLVYRDISEEVSNLTEGQPAAEATCTECGLSFDLGDDMIVYG